MTISSVGYDGTVDEVQWAQLARHLGAGYAVLDDADWKVTTVAGLDRGVQVAAGVGYGHGIRDTNSAPVTLQLPTIASGTRWDLIVANRDWQPPGGTTIFTYRTGTASKAIPSGRLSNPGVLDDQPIALAQVTAGSTAVTGLVDLRTWPHKVITATDLLALPSARRGTIALVGGVPYRRDLDGAGSLVWLSLGSLGELASAERSTGAGGTGLDLTTNTAVDGLLAGFTLPSRRRVRLTFTGMATSDVAGTEVGISVSLGGAGGFGFPVPIALANKWLPVSFHQDVTLDAGSYTAQVLLGRVSGSGNVSLPATSTTKLQLSVQDLRTA